VSASKNDSVPWSPNSRARAFQLLLLTAAAASANYGQTALGPLQEAIRIATGLGDNQMAVLQGPALALPLAFAAIPVGLLIDRYSRARLLLIFGALNLVAALATTLATGFVSLFIARCLVGLVVPSTSMTALSMIADIFQPAQRGRALMIMAIGQVGGMSVAFAAGGGLLRLAGAAPNSWRWAMGGLSAPIAVITALLLFAKEPSRRSVAVNNPSTRAAFSELWRYRRLIAPLLAGVVMVGLVDTASIIWAVPTLIRNFSLTSDRVGAIMSAGLLTAGLTGPLLGGALADISQRGGGPRRTMTCISALSVVSAISGLFAVMPGVFSASVALTIFMTTGIAISVTGAPIATIVIPNELRGLYMAVQAAISTPLCLGLAPVVVSVLSGALGGQAKLGEALAIVCVTTSLASAITFAVGRRRFPGTDRA
jgi:MFS family permease